MIHKVLLPDESTIGIQYSNKVYSPKYSSYRDTIGLADACIKEVKPSRLVDVACGSGVLGLALKKLNPFLDVYLSDVDPDAIKQTKANAKRLGLSVTVLEADLLPKTQFFPVVVANLPTFDEEQLFSEELHGPLTSYVGGGDGLDLYRKLLSQIEVGAFLICEVQEKSQPGFLKLLAELADFQVVASSQNAFALFHLPNKLVI